jgi:DNA-binding transcriptional LysR family regulator
LVSQTAAVEAGFGVMVMPRGRALRNHLNIWEDGPLPKLPNLYGVICIRDGGGSAIAELADYLNDQVRDYTPYPI